MTLLLESGSNRIGANDFQHDHRHYRPRLDTASFAELLDGADRVMRGERLPAGVAEALVHGTSVGGARPKVLVQQGSHEFIGKLSSSTDPYPVVKAEAAAMFLAKAAGVDTAATRLVQSGSRDVLLVRRFDREAGGLRRHVVSGLTMLGLDEMMGRYATYPDLLSVLREHGSAVGPEMFDRVAVNIVLGNFDDHARNHAAFWDGQRLTLTPAYDICPQPRTGETAYQAMAYGTEGKRASRLADLISASGTYGLTSSEGRARAHHIIDVTRSEWSAAVDHAQLTQADEQVLWGRLILNPAALRDVAKLGSSGAAAAAAAPAHVPRGTTQGGQFASRRRGEPPPLSSLAD